MKAKEILSNGIIRENPIFRLVLGMCPTLAVTTAAINGLGMGVAVIFVLSLSNLAISLLKDYIPEKVRIPCLCSCNCILCNNCRYAYACFYPSPI